ncbi:hypothetical protein [Streptomyces boluensis]|uniref:Uncharacterized protein n=1 Tax=Streptomyces boluensis TaxID=1775135 RepID=A0A964UNE3_9ACTN|nr:hypothetical protein [Streptomyces boluensis]NBE52339.1 hypothetical protein [Streptomyces boluensis]
MSAPAHTRSAPRPTGGIAARLPWWAVALPTAAFVVLLALVLHPSDAQVATGASPVADVLAQLRQALPF